MRGVWESLTVKDRVFLLVAFIFIVGGAGMFILIQKNDGNIDDVQDQNDQLQNTVNDLQRSVRHLESFVDGLEEETPNEEARSAAITQAVTQIPEIRLILCQQFPDAAAAVNVTCPQG